MIRLILEWPQPTFQWIDLENPSPEDFSEVARKVSLHPTSIQDCLDPEHHPKYEKVENSHFFILRSFDKYCPPTSDTIEELTRKIAIFVQDDRILTVHRIESHDLNKIADKWAQILPTKEAPMWNLVNELMRASLRTFDQPLDDMDREIGRLEANFFAKRDVKQAPLDIEKIYMMKRKLGIFRRNFRLTMDSLSRLALSDQTKIPFIEDIREEAESYYYFAADLIESLNNLANIEISLASHQTNMASHETNEVIRFLTIYSIFFMPLNLIVGFYGMNLSWLPMANHPSSFYWISGAMLLTSLTIYGWFWKMNWIQNRKH